MRAGHRPLKPHVVILGLLLTGACAGRDDPEYAFDFSGIDPFWDVHDTLAADAEPSDSLWEALWNTPGYELLERVERRRSALSDGFRLAFRPSMRTAADSVLAGAELGSPHHPPCPADRPGPRQPHRFRRRAAVQ